jgi:hypothetical protein
VTAAVPASAVKSGKAVTLPVEVAVAGSTDNAPAVKISVSGTAKVEIPVENVTPGAVAVIVKADGTQEIVKMSTVTDSGVALTLAVWLTTPLRQCSGLWPMVSIGGTTGGKLNPEVTATRAAVAAMVSRYVSAIG